MKKDLFHNFYLQEKIRKVNGQTKCESSIWKFEKCHVHFYMTNSANSKKCHNDE